MLGVVRPQGLHAAAPRCRARRAPCAVRASIKSVRKDALEGGKYRETFAVNLLGLGKQTEQVLQGGPGTELLPLCIKRPLGVIFAEQVPKGFGQATLCVVDELVPGSNAEAAGVRVGDTLRLVTAVVSVRDKTDTLSYYTNPPKARSRRALLVSDGQPFSKMMKALISNSEAVDMPSGEEQVFPDIPLVLERTL